MIGLVHYAESVKKISNRTKDKNREGENLLCGNDRMRYVSGYFYARNSFISALAHHGGMTAYIDYAVGHATSEVSTLLAGYISNVTPAMMQAYNGSYPAPEQPIKQNQTNTQSCR
ncbi:hypothetical protein [Bacteroides acidifaciens]|uniref:hypothetical protein n=2 Tax=Bacteroidia TaxID=200643 RepID=UPI00258A5EB7|nr:hypothetical protein [Bacteroides acidifaciens]